MSRGKKRHYATVLIICITLILILSSLRNTESKSFTGSYEIVYDQPGPTHLKDIAGIVERNETLYSIFHKNDIDMRDLSKLQRSSRELFNLNRIRPGRSYILRISEDYRINELLYSIDDYSYLQIQQDNERTDAEIKTVEYEKRTGFITGRIEDNLLSAFNGNNEYIKVVYDLTDILAWDIDFNTDLRKGDTLKIAVEELWYGSILKGLGDIFAVEFVNDGNQINAYRFDDGVTKGYYDGDGKSLRKSLLRVPLRFHYISSRYTKKRRHPILKIYRSHLGVDYVAPSGTPVSASGDGKVIFAGRKGRNGNLVIIKHSSGYRTYYGHLKRFARSVEKGKHVKQGEIIGYVGSTGLSTGPHLDYRIKYRDRFVNPLTVSLPRSSSVPDRKRSEFQILRSSLQKKLDSPERET